MTLPAAVLAIDGGNSKTDVALIGFDGSVLGTARGGASNHQTVGREQALAVLTDLVAAAATAAGLPAGRTDHLARHTSACLAGADLPEEEAELGTAIQAQGWSATSAVVNDTFAVLRAGLDDDRPPGQHWGIAVVCGAGTNCVGVGPDGKTTRFLALGYLSGDWGGGSTLGPDALWWAIRAEDGRGPETELRRAVADHFGKPSVHDAVVAIYLGEIDYSELHGLVPLLLKVAGGGDAVAQSVVHRQAEEVCRMATAAARKLGLAGTGLVGLRGPLPVVLGGSVLAARDPGLTTAISEQMAAALPGSEVRIVDVPPIAGAALLGLDHVGAPPAAATRLRESVVG